MAKKAKKYIVVKQGKRPRYLAWITTHYFKTVPPRTTRTWAFHPDLLAAEEYTKKDAEKNAKQFGGQIQEV